MLPLELRATGVDHAWNELRLQRRLPFVVLSDTKPLLPRSSNSSSPLRRNLPARRNRHFSAEQTSFHARPKLDIYPESLQDTLEAHRRANRAAETPKPRTENGKKQGPWLVRSSFLTSDAEKPKQEHSRYGSKPVFVDYQGVSQPPKGEWEISRSSLADYEKRPWLYYFDHTKRRSEDVYDYLTAEIFAFEKYMKPNASERAAAGKVISDVRKIVESVDSNIKMSVIGSRGTGLAMPLSDIDISIKHPILFTKTPGQRGPSPGRPEARKQMIELLTTVKRKLKKKGGPKATFGIAILIEAKVPIVNALHKHTGLEIQLQCTGDGNTSMELVKAYMEEYPTLRPLFFVLRQVLKMRGLGNPQSCGIGSYPLIMMIVAALKFSSPRFDSRDAGRQLLYFLDFYSKINYTTTGISVDPPELFPKREPGGLMPLEHRKADFQDEKSDGAAFTDSIEATLDTSHGRHQISCISPSRPYLMCLQDPARATNDLGSQAAAIKHVRSTLWTLALKTRTSMDMFGSKHVGAAPFSLLEPCLAADYSAFRKKRQRLGSLVVGDSTPEPLIAKYL
jgi:non-canonical poly(A) RNA polymerase PAPD5/7